MNKLDKESVIGISALLIHAANIDEIYSDHEKDLVKIVYLLDELNTLDTLASIVMVLPSGIALLNDT